MAAEEGFEPSQTESESGVLPLHNSAKRKSYYTYIFAFVKLYFLIIRKNFSCKNDLFLNSFQHNTQ